MTITTSPRTGILFEITLLEQTLILRVPPDDLGIQYPVFPLTALELQQEILEWPLREVRILVAAYQKAEAVKRETLRKWAQLKSRPYGYAAIKSLIERNYLRERDHKVFLTPELSPIHQTCTLEQY